MRLDQLALTVTGNAARPTTRSPRSHCTGFVILFVRELCDLIDSLHRRVVHSAARRPEHGNLFAARGQAFPPPFAIDRDQTRRATCTNYMLAHPSRRRRAWSEHARYVDECEGFTVDSSLAVKFGVDACRMCIVTSRRSARAITRARRGRGKKSRKRPESDTPTPRNRSSGHDGRGARRARDAGREQRPRPATVATACPALETRGRRRRAAVTRRRDEARDRESRASGCSPEQIRTAVTALRGRRPRPLDDGAGLLRSAAPDGSGGRTRTPNHRTRTCCVADYTTPEWER